MCGGCEWNIRPFQWIFWRTRRIVYCEIVAVYICCYSWEKGGFLGEGDAMEMWWKRWMLNGGVLNVAPDEWWILNDHSTVLLLCERIQFSVRVHPAIPRTGRARDSRIPEILHRAAARSEACGEGGGEVEPSEGCIEGNSEYEFNRIFTLVAFWRPYHYSAIIFNIKQDPIHFLLVE